MVEFLIETFFFLGKLVEAAAMVGGLSAFVGVIWLICSGAGIRLMEWILQDPEDEYEA